MLINNSAVKLLLENPPPAEIVYDDWIQFLVQFFGKIHFIQKPLMLYRLHGENATGVPYRGGSKVKSVSAFWKNIESAENRIAKKIRFLQEIHKLEIFSDIYDANSTGNRVNFFKLRKSKFKAFQKKEKLILFTLYQLKILTATFFKNLRRRV
jgi:hypothetical protein